MPLNSFSLKGLVKRDSFVARPREQSVNPSALKITDCYKFSFGDHERPNVLVLFCGGTLIMRENEDGSLVVEEKDKAIEMLLNMEPRITEVANLDCHYIDNIDSSNMSPEVKSE